MKKTIYSLFEKTVKENENSPAIIENNRTMTFGELSALTDMIAGTFPEKVTSVGIVMNHRAEMIAAIFAVLKCGARYVPAEPSFPTGRIRYMMSEAAVDFILTERECADKLAGFDLRLTDCEICGLDNATERKDCSRPEQPAYVLYTSGTTGKPKGVCVTNGNVCHYVKAFANEFHPHSGDIMLQNHLPSIPASLRLLISGGDVLRGVYVDNLLDKAQVYNTYGPSETTVCASYYHCNGGKVLADGTYPIGKAVRGTVIRILDAAGRELPAGEVGEICIYGDGVSLGYIGDRKEENKAFEKLPDGSAMYRSGDLGYVLPDGNIAFLYRKDTQIMIMGKRVEVSEVESRLYQCQSVQQAIVRAYTDEDGLSYMIAYVVPSEKNIKVSAIKRELSENLTSFMIPEFFVRMPSIPLNTNGKPDAAQLPVVLKAGNFA